MPHTNIAMIPPRPAHAGGTTSTSSSATTHPQVQAQGQGQGQGHEEVLVSALQAALHSLSGSSPGDHDRNATTVAPSLIPARIDVPGPMPVSREKGHAMSLDISIANDQLQLRGTGVDVEPTLLSGSVILHLSEPTSIKQIVLVFRGKARVPNNPHDPHVLNSSPSQYIVCNHEWTFLEGEKKHSHTLKAGRHLFPFELRLGGSLPSSLATYVNGGASISYKLRATAVRPGLSTNLTTSIPVTLLRTFAPESLEYQQTLEIENTWPEKVMYALMIPHKAWAAGDELTALLKFAPLSKGVCVLSVTTHLCETTKTLARGGHLEKTRSIVTSKHEIVNGQAVCVEDQTRKRLHNALQSTLGEQGRQSTGLSNYSGRSSPGLATSAFVSGTSTPVLEGPGFSLVRSRTHESVGSESGSGSSSYLTNLHAQEDTDGGETEVTTSITIPLPPTLTPTHSLDPIIVSYRIRWSVLLANLDGHTSELRCSLPVHILDFSLLDEARTATLATRRLLFGGEDAPREAGEEDAQLPSYPSHVRDRVAVDLALPEVNALGPFATFRVQPDSGATTPAHEGGPHSMSEPGFMQDSASSPFAFGAPLSRAQTHSVVQQAGRNVSGESSSAESSRPNTRPNSRHDRESAGGGWGPFSRSRLHSRANSRAPSPDRGEHTTNVSLSVARADETHVHASNAASRQPHGLFSVVMKPLTSFAVPWHASAHTAALAQHFQNTYAHAQRTGSGSGNLSSLGGGSGSTGDLRGLVASTTIGIGSVTVPTTPFDGNGIGGFRAPASSTSAVPDYFTAAHARGGVPPLETLRGLPTYEDSEAQVRRMGSQSPSIVDAMEPQRSFSDSDLVAHFARMRGQEPQRVR